MVSLRTVNSARLIFRYHVYETIISCSGRLLIHFFWAPNLNNGIQV